MNIIKTALQTLLYFKYRFFDICFLVSGSFHLSTYSTFCCILFGKTRISESSLRQNNLGLWAEASPKHHFITPPQCKQGQVKNILCHGIMGGRRKDQYVQQLEARKPPVGGIKKIPDWTLFW